MEKDGGDFEIVAWGFVCALSSIVRPSSTTLQVVASCISRFVSQAQLAPILLYSFQHLPLMSRLVSDAQP